MTGIQPIQPIDLAASLQYQQQNPIESKSNIAKNLEASLNNPVSNIDIAKSLSQSQNNPIDEIYKQMGIGRNVDVLVAYVVHAYSAVKLYQFLEVYKDIL